MKIRYTRREIAASSALWAGIAAAVLVGTHTHTYNGLNAGVVVGTEQAHVGLEVRGFPGVFVGLGDRQWTVYVADGRIQVQR